jgi:hypothetical protein
MTIVRTKTKATGGVTDAEMVQLKEVAQYWIKNALRTDRVNPAKLNAAVKKLYEVSKLAEPLVIIVPSPLVMALAGAVSSVFLEMAKGGKTDFSYSLLKSPSATPEYTDKDQPFCANVDWPGYYSTQQATYLAIAKATEGSSNLSLSTLPPLTGGTSDNLSWLPPLVEQLVGKQNTKNVLAKIGVWSDMYDNGNFGSGSVSYLSAARDVLGLELEEHKAYAPYEQCCIEGGYRLMSETFCMVSDRPEVLKLDNENRAHCEDGPSHRWTDGWSLYHWHGVKIPADWIEKKSELTAQTALTWENVEQRRVACEIVGWAKILKELKARVIDKDGDPEIGTLLEVDLPDSPGERFIYVKCGTGREFALPVPKDCGDTALAANAWTYGLEGATYRPEVRT